MEDNCAVHWPINYTHTSKLDRIWHVEWLVPISNILYLDEVGTCCTHLTHNIFVLFWHKKWTSIIHKKYI